MKLFSTNIFARLDRTNLSFSPFVIAESKNDALGKINVYIRNHPRLNQAQIKSIVVVEESVIY